MEIESAKLNHGKHFTSEEREALQAVIDLAWLMISDDGKVEPGNEEAVAAIETVEKILKHSE